jgi:hypothetical protein
LSIYSLIILSDNNIIMQVVDKVYTENDNTYVSIAFTNKISFVEQILEYNVTKTNPIIDNASEYYCSVVSFQIPLGAIPIAIMPIVPGQGNPNLSTLQVGIRNGGTNFLQNVIYVPQNRTVPPVQSDPNQQVVTQYYFIYSIEQMLVMINTALQLAYTAAGLVATAPYFIYTSSTQLISLIVGAQFNVNGGPQVIHDYNTFQYINAYDVTGIGGGIYSINVFGVVNESYGYAIYGTAPTNPPTFYKITQEYQYFAAWNPIRKILFVSNTLPIKYEVVPNNNVTANNDGVYSSIPILTDFTPIVTGSGDNRSTAYYNTNGTYGLRLVDMTSTKPVYKLDIKVYWQDIGNNLYQLYIPNFQSAAIKLAFTRKTIYKNC